MAMMAHKAKNDHDDNSGVRSVAIIGGGLAGLSCARHLQQKQQDPKGLPFRVTVFDTGRLRPGGRASSRRPNDDKSKSEKNNKREKSNQKDTSSSWLDSFPYDHAAQFIVSSRAKRSSSSSALAFDSDDSSWRSDFDDWIYELHSQGILQMAPPNSIFKVQLLRTGNSVVDMESTAATKKKNKQIQKIHYESLQASSSSSFDFFYPTRGMAALSEVLVNRGETTFGPSNNNHIDVGLTLDVRQDVWVSPSNGVEYLADTNQWLLKAKGRPLGTFDDLVLAHNGKCAERLIRPTPAKRVHKLMRVNFKDRIAVVINNNNNNKNSNAGQKYQDDAQTEPQKMTLNSLYSYTVCLEAPSVLKQALPDGFVAGFVTTATTTTSSTNATTDSEKDQHHYQQQRRVAAAAHGRISMITNQVPGKYDDNNNNIIINNTNNNNNKKNCEIWTIFSTATFAKQYKAPQEALPDDVQEEVCRLLLESLQTDIVDVAAMAERTEEKTTTTSATPPPVLLQDKILDQRLQLWGAAVPLNVWESHSGDIDDNDRSANSNNSTNDHQQKLQDGFLYDAEYGVGVCGDWLMEPSLAGAWTSGKRLADHLLKTSSTTSSSSSPPASVGFQGGQFRVTPAVQQLGIAALWDTDGDDDDFDYGDNDDDLTSKPSNNVSRRKPSSRNGSSGDSKQRGSNHFKNNQRGRHKSSRNRTLSGSNKNGGQVTSTTE